MQPQSAIPNVYYALFAWYEPLLTIGGLVGALLDPKAIHDQQAPWPSDGPPTGPLPLATTVTMLQLAHVCALLGLLNYFVLSALRTHLHAQPALQEKIATALLTPLLIGDGLHLYVTLWALGEQRWDLHSWGVMLWLTVGLGLSIMVPRIAWHIGIGRYVHSRDGQTPAEK
ncbi:hypothetical protein PLICRDRAFT_48108 [Plicaturopsis crispa FD-325 SS-3]|nr:hypothetical protein PLICRDRAFT_48108 [Plicaturopsis crispa FD-325 SS-3]